MPMPTSTPTPRRRAMTVAFATSPGLRVPRAPSVPHALSVAARPPRLAPRSRRRLVACAPANPHPELSPAALALFRRQAATPIFAPALAAPRSAALAARIADLQAASPPGFVTATDLRELGLLPDGTDTETEADAEAVARGAAADHLATRAVALVSAARADTLRAFPGIDAPGGALYPAFRADACWRDLAAFVRVAGYCAAAAAPAYSPDGLAVLRDVYAELEVPTPAVAHALAALRAAAAAGVDAAARDHIDAALRPLEDAVAAMHARSG